MLKFGLTFANLGIGRAPDTAIELAIMAEQLGFESLWTVEHPVVPRGYASSYPYSLDGKMGVRDDYPLPDPLIWLTWVAAATRRIRLATGILLLPLRNPVILAKELATLDSMSGGRVTLGIGTGWLREEFDAVGVPWARRGARTDEYIATLRTLWNDDESSFHGEFVNFDNVLSYPKPAQTGGIPIVVGGQSEAAARRAGSLGDGYFPGAEPARLIALLDIMRTAATEAGRDPGGIEVTTASSPERSSVEAWRDLGVTRVVLPNAGHDLEACKSYLGTFSERVIAKLG